MIEVGTPVIAADGFRGIVSRHKGGPDGNHLHEITSLDVLPRRRSYIEAELTVEPTPPAPPYPIGSVVRCYGQTLEIVNYDAESQTYEAIGLRQIGGENGEPGFVVIGHWYPEIPSCDLWLWNEAEEPTDARSPRGSRFRL